MVFQKVATPMPSGSANVALPSVTIDLPLVCAAYSGMKSNWDWKNWLDGAG